MNKNISSFESKANIRAQNSIKKMHEKEKIIQFLNIADNSLQPKNAVHIDEPIFQPEPKVILFTDYEPLQLRTQILKLRNRDIVPRRVSIIHPETRLFQVTPYKKIRKDNKNQAETFDMANTKVASGMEVSYLIKFTPEAKVDVRYDLVVITEREKFIVPIIGIGCKVMLEFNETLDFGEVPVKYKIEKPIILRNVGEKITKWKLKCASLNISVSKKEGILEIGKSEQIICTFCPQDDREYEEDMILTYDEFEAVIKIYGRSKNDQVSLNKKVVELDPAYITKHSQAFVTINNNTNVPIDFVWKRHESKEMEDNAKKETFERLNRQEEEEKILNELQYDYEEVQGDRSFDIDDSYDEEEILKINERHHLKNLTIIARRFEKIKKCLNEDQMLFEHDNFQIEPLQGKIWPNTGMNISLTFKPMDAIQHQVFAYCDVTGLDYRMKLQLKGLGIGPKAELSYNEKNLLDIPITSTLNISDIEPLIIKNTGVIDCAFRIRPSQTPCGKQFKFGIADYVLKPPGEDKNNGEKVIPIEFHAERLGEFSEKFIIEITRSKREIPIIFKGHVIAPSCRFDLGTNKIGTNGGIEFGAVSLLQSKPVTVSLINDSKVDIRFKLRISSDSEDHNIASIFDIKPSSGSIKSMSNLPITITFRPDIEKAYDIVILMDMEDIGYDMLTLPVSGECKIPEIKIDVENEIAFGKVYIGKPENSAITLINTHKTLMSQYEIVNLDTDNSNNQYGKIEVDNQKGNIDYDSSVKLNIKLTTTKTGPISLKLDIKCKTKANANNKDGNNITTLRITADSQGPNLFAINNVENLNSLKVLEIKEHKIVIKNSSPIVGNYTAFMKNPKSIFSVHEKDRFGTVEPMSSKEIRIICKPDNAGYISEVLYFKVEHGKDFEVIISCTTKGHCIVIDPVTCPSETTIDFGILFTKCLNTKPIKFINKGTKTQMIKWNKLKESNKNKEEITNLPNNKKPKEEEEEPVFTFKNNLLSFLIPEKKICTCTLQASSETVGEKIQKYDILAFPEGQNGTNTEPLRKGIMIKACFISPLMKYYPEKTEFEYTYQKGKTVDVISRTLEIENIAELKSHFSLSVPPPFSFLDPKTEYMIEPKKKEKVTILFDPVEFRESKRIVKDMVREMIVKHKNHPQEEKVSMSVTLNFPNLNYSLAAPRKITFDSIINDTYDFKTFDITNDSEMEVYYEWVLIEDEKSYEELQPPKQKSKREPRKIPLNEVFAIVPMSGVLNKKEKETIRVTFNPGSNMRYNAKMKCLIEGGPEEVISLSGEASSVSFKILLGDQELFSSSSSKSNTPCEINLGKIPFNKVSNVELEIKNDGFVDFHYVVNYCSQNVRYVHLSTHKGKAMHQDSNKILIDVIPGVPDFIQDMIEIEAAHIEPVKIIIKAVGTYSGIIVNLPRKLKTDTSDLTPLNRKELVNSLYPKIQERKLEIKNYLPQGTDKKKKKEPIKSNIVHEKTGMKEAKLIKDISKEDECEMEFNRIKLTEMLNNKIKINEVQSSLVSNPGSTNIINYRINQINSLMKDLKVAEYYLVFGDLITRSKETKSFRIFNQNESYVTVTFDKKEFDKKGYFISSPSVPNLKDVHTLPPFSYIDIEITHNTDKVDDYKEVRNNLRIIIKEVSDAPVNLNSSKESGEVYDIELITYVSQPNIQISNTEINFDNVFIGRKKIIKFMIENYKKVVARWDIQLRDKDDHIYKIDETKSDEFTISPINGVLNPGKKQIITCCFIPTKERQYYTKACFMIDESKPKDFVLKGNGKDIALELLPAEISLDPVLPYYKYALGKFEIRNPNDIDVEVISLDFDQQYLQEEDLIRFYKDFNKGTPTSIDISIRKAGVDLWPLFKKYKEKYNNKLEELRIKGETNPITEYLYKYATNKFIDFEDIEEEDLFKYPHPISEEDKNNIIIIGPPKSGKTSLCLEQKKIHKRGIVDMNTLLEWNKEHGFTESLEKAEIYLEDKKKELELVKAEREKVLKKAKTDKKIKVEELPPIIDKKYQVLSNDILVELLNNRLSHEDCSVGAVFDNLENNLIELIDQAIELIEEALRNQNITILKLAYPKDKHGLDVCRWIDFQNIVENKLELKPIRYEHNNNKKRTVNSTINSRRQTDQNYDNKGIGNSALALKKNNTLSKNTKNLNTGKDKKFNSSHQDKNQRINTTNSQINHNIHSISPEEKLKNGHLTINEIVELHGKDLAFTSPKELTNEEKEEYETLCNHIADKLNELSLKRNDKLEEYKQYLVQKEIFDEEKRIKKEEEERQKLEDQEQKSEGENELNHIENKENIEGNSLMENDKSYENKEEKYPYLPEQKKVSREIKTLNIEYSIKSLLNNYLETIKEPQLIPPEKLPIPAPEEYQILRYPNIRPERVPVQNFTLKSINPDYINIDNPVDLEEVKQLLMEEDKRYSEKVKEMAAIMKDPKKKKAYEEEKKKKEKDKNYNPKKEEEEMKLKPILKEQTRWIIPARSTIPIIIWFFSKEVGLKQQKLGFEALTYPPKEFKLSISAHANYPQLNTVGMSIKKPGTIGLLGKNKKIEEDFGYLLIIKDEITEYSKFNSTHLKTLRFTNNGLFDVEVKFVFLSSLNQENLGFNFPIGSQTTPEDTSTNFNPKDKDKKNKNTIVEPITPFILGEEKLIIKKEETKSLQVYAFPNRSVEYRDELICLIQDNPTPIQINLSCKGCEPKLEVEPDLLEFEKLIVNQASTKTIRLRNVGEVPCSWTFSVPNNTVIPPQFKFSSLNGTIEKKQEQVITVDFCSDHQEKFSFTLNVDCEDNLGYGAKIPTRMIKINAEAFKVSVEPIISAENKILDFGNIKVKDYKIINFSLKNHGIYKVKFKFEINPGKKLWNDLFKFEPSEGEIEATKERPILAICMPYPKDIAITSENTEIKLIIFEGEKNSKYQEIPIFVNVASLFSKYTINPVKNINFGSFQYNEQNTRSIEIRNEGQFEFNYEVSEFLEESIMKKIREDKSLKELEEQKQKEQEMKEAIDNLNNVKDTKKKQPNVPDKKKQDDKKKGKEDNILKISRFNISNFKGSIPPGSSAKLDIAFVAEGHQFYQSVLCFDILGRNPDDNPLGIPFDLIGESCIPGIETTDYDNIFEEQTVLPSLNPEINKQHVINSSIFSLEDKVFWYGTIIASKNPDGVVEKFKIINPNKIACTVKINLIPRTNSKSEGFAFEVSHKVPLKIYPHESEYVSVTFKPTNVIPYSGIFEAIVEGGESNPDTGILRFELRGEGTLPTLLLDSPNVFSDDGTPILKFNKTRINKYATANIVLKNDGVVPATVKFDNFNNPAFSFNCSTTSTIQPKNYMSFEMKFEPKSVGIEKYTINYKTLYNPYENPRLILTGEGYFEAISFEELEKENELEFGDLCVGSYKTITFQIQNHSDTPQRFNFLNIYEPYIEIKPSVGYLLGHSYKEIVATFSVKENDVKDLKEPIKFVNKDLYCETKQIKFSANEMEWDNTYKIKKKVTPSEYAAFQKKQAEENQKRKEEMEGLFNIIAGIKKPPEKKKDDKKKKEEDIKPNPNEEANIDIEEVLPEPAYVVIEKTEKYPNIKIFGTADYARYQCSVKAVKFKPTMMYASRKHEFHLKNTSNINLNYNFSFTNPYYIGKDFSGLNHSFNQMSLSNSHYITHAIQKYNPYNDPGPFSILPKSGTIPPNSDETIVLRFSPLEVDELYFSRQLICHIKDLDPNLKDLTIDLSGDSERPVCHFELQGGIKQENGYTILDFESIGMMVLNTKKFFVLNPTNLAYEFEWEALDEDNPNYKMFKCLTPKGVIYSGKKFEMCFEYLPSSLGQHDTYWNFKVQSEKIVHKFLFIGQTREPMILFNVGKVNFGNLLIGGRNKEMIQIINEEHIPYKYYFEKESIKGNNSYGDSLFVTPIAGTLQPKSSSNIEITFMPRVEKEFNYNLCLKIRNRQKPLMLNVKGVGYNINHNVFLDNKPELKLYNKQEHVIDFGEFFIKEKKERSIILENNGAFNFHYVFKKNGADYLKITPESSTVKKSEKLIINLTILALNKLSLKNHKIFLQIVSGPIYTFVINAKARSPNLSFSATKIDFGLLYIQRPPQPITQIITIKNLDKEALTIETNFENKNKSHLDVQLSTGQVILPFTSKLDILEIPIVFTPREVCKYKEVVNFKFNGIYDQEVEITGEGIPLKLEIEENIQTLNFGIIQLGQNRKMEFNILNKGKMKADIQIFPENKVNFNKRFLQFLSIDTNKNYRLDPKQSLKVEILFNPNTRIPLFTEELFMKINNNDQRRLISVSGASYGVDIKMVGDLPPFGTVVANSLTQRNIVLKNFGDLPAKFKWEVPNPKKDYSKFFTFYPMYGTIPPHEEVIISITFHPKIVSNNIYFEKIKCNIENFDPILINLYGKSCEVPKESITEKRLETEVRVPIVYEIKLKNNSDKLWRLTPTISTVNEQFMNYFKGEHSFEIKAGVEGTYLITYNPLTMSYDKEQKQQKVEHEATVFFPLPDGTAKVHKITGFATEPKAKKSINETCKAREWKTITLSINNWLYSSQRFRVTWKVDKNDPCIFIKGANTIDVGGNSTKEYKLSYKSWKDLSCVITINFENVESKEYLYYMINMVTVPADPFEPTLLSGQVREMVSNSITVINPLKEDITISSSQVTCDNEYVIIKPNNFVIKAESEVSLELTYRPLLVSQLNSNIIIKSTELGELKFPLLLKGVSLPPPKQLQTISTTLGAEKIITFNFLNYIKKATQYTVKIEKLNDNMPNTMDFIPEQTTISTQPADFIKGNEVVAKVKYEPYFIGENRALLKVSSIDGGEYSFILVGVCNSPQAQGPFKVPIGKEYKHEFKNPLNESAEISVRFDNPNFVCGKIAPKIESKKTTIIPISFKNPGDNKFTGRLIVTLNKLPPWIIYLQAE